MPACHSDILCDYINDLILNDFRCVLCVFSVHSQWALAVWNCVLPSAQELPKSCPRLMIYLNDRRCCPGMVRFPSHRSSGVKNALQNIVVVLINLTNVLLTSIPTYFRLSFFDANSMQFCKACLQLRYCTPVNRTFPAKSPGRPTPFLFHLSSDDSLRNEPAEVFRTNKMS